MKLCWEAMGSGVMCEGSPYIVVTFCDSSYQLICLISWPILIALRCNWHQSKGLFEGFL